MTNSRYKWMFLGVVLAMTACSGPAGEPTIEKVSELPDNIPYEALGSGTLAFVRDGNFFVIDADAKTNWGLKGLHHGGVISPDGKYIVYPNAGSSTASIEIFVYDIQNDMSTQITESQFCDNPGWTADSKYVVYEIYSAHQHAIHKLAITKWDLSTVTALAQSDRLTSMISVSNEDELAFSLITYNSSEEMTSGVFTKKKGANGLNQKVVNSTGSTALSPAWSPNGELIAYINYQIDETQSTRETQVMVMNKHGSNGSTLATFEVLGTHNIFLDVNPSIAWSPDGTMLVFNVFEESGSHIYVVNVDGTGLTKITSQGGAKDDQLSWSK